MSKRRPRAGSGFWLSLGLNLVFQGEWLLAAFATLVLHYLFDTPVFLVWIALGIWILAALLVTGLLSCMNDPGDKSRCQGQRTSERLKRREQENT